MSQLISATSPLPRAPNAKAEPSGEPAGEAAAAGEGFAALLAGLFALPVAPTIVAQPATPVLLKGQAPIEPLPADALPDDALAEQGTANEPANGSGDQEQPLGGGAAPPSIAGSGSIPGGTVAPVANTEAPVTMPRGGMDTPAALPPADDKPATMPTGEAKAIATSGVASSAAAGAAPIERRHGEQRAPSERSPAPVAATREGAVAPGVRTVAGVAPPTVPTDQKITVSAMPGFARLGLAWQADLADLGAGALSTGLVATDGIAGSAERSAMAITDQAASGTARPVQQLALAIERAVNGEIRQLTIQLSPRELGTIEIAIELDADRRLTVAIMAERPETLDLLRQDSRQLERLLGQQGLNLADAGLELGLMNQERREGRERPLPAALDLARTDAAEGHGEAGPAPPTPWLGTAHRLNLSI